MKRISFTMGLIPLIQNGTKTQTRRKITGRWGLNHKEYVPNMTEIWQFKPTIRYKAGDVCKIINSRFKPKECFGFIKILSVESVSLLSISKQDAVCEGFANEVEFILAYRKIHKLTGIISPKLSVWKITFEFIGANYDKE